jgi:hypothetical protein
MATNPLSFEDVRSGGLPVYSLTMEEKWQQMRLLLGYDRSRLIEGGIVGQSMHALGLAWHYFPHAWGVRCGGKLSPLDTFADDDRLHRAMLRRERYGPLNSQSDLRKALKAAPGSQGVSNFRPTAAAALYDRYMPEGGGVTWDMSAGYGGRLLGAIASNRVRKYIGTDPASLTFDGLSELAAELPAIAEQFGSELTGVELHKMGSERYDPTPESIDLCFTSPPYFDCEKYSDEETQSHVKYGRDTVKESHDAWLNGFMKGTLTKCAIGLKPNGTLVINIANVASYPNLTEDFLWLAQRCGFRHIETLRITLAAMPGTRKGSPYKFEPVYVFKRS